MSSAVNKLPSNSENSENKPKSLELELKEREVAAREREVAAKEREVAAKEKELQRSRWTSPLVIGLIAATLGLLGNLTVAIVNNKATRDVERRKEQNNLVVELIRTGDPGKAAKNLLFFLDHGLLDDPDGSIRKSLADQQTTPVLPAAATPSVKTLGGLKIVSNPPGANVTLDGKPAGVTDTQILVSTGSHLISVALGERRLDREAIVKEGEWTQLSFSFR